MTDEAAYSTREPTTSATSWTEGWASFSTDGTRRRSIGRIWDRSRGRVAFCALNPSKASEKDDDATLRRYIGFAKTWGFGSVEGVNAFDIISTDPAALYACAMPSSRENDDYIVRAFARADLFVFAWGVHGSHLRRGDAVRQLLDGQIVSSLGLTKNFQPVHPLRLPARLFPRVFRARWSGDLTGPALAVGQVSCSSCGRDVSEVVHARHLMCCGATFLGACCQVPCADKAVWRASIDRQHGTCRYRALSMEHLPALRDRFMASLVRACDEGPRGREREVSLMHQLVNVHRVQLDRPMVGREHIERAERMAFGHADYGQKFALYCAELAVAPAIPAVS